MLQLSQAAKRAIDAWWSNLVSHKKPVFLALTAFFLPTQLGRHFWPDFAYVDGLRSDYLSPAIYATDFLIATIFAYVLFAGILAFKKTGHLPKLTLSSSQRAYLLLWGLLLFSGLLSIFSADNKEASLFHLAKLLEFGLWGLLVSFVLAKPIYRSFLLFGFLSGALLQALLGLGQFSLAHSLGFWVLGERTFNPETPGIAQAVLDGNLVLRAYGTLPHPNVLGFWLLLAGNISLWLALKRRDFWKWFLLLIFLLFSLGILATLSRLAIGLWAATSIILVGYAMRGSIFVKRSIFKLAAGLVLTLLLLSPALPLVTARFASLADTDYQSVKKRLELSDKAMTFWQENPLTGIGLGNFVVRQSGEPATDFVPFIQPAHNHYLLVAAEVGIIGLVSLLGLLSLAEWRAFRSKTLLLAVIILEVILVGFFDHFYWTLQQGGLIWWSIIGGLFSPMVGRAVIPARLPAQRS